MIKQEEFFGYEKYTISAKRLQVSVLSLGATVTSLLFDGRETVLGYDTPAAYLHGSSYIGAVVGRYANRICGAGFAIDGRAYSLSPNEGENQLHGGPEAFDRRVWQGESLGENAIRFTLDSPDGDNGYPGNLTAAVTYTVLDTTLRIDFAGRSDRDTVFAPTSHMYFNLGGTEHILDTTLRINADAYVPVDGRGIPLGGAKPVDAVFDFRTARPIARDYDHCFILTDPVACRASAGGVGLEICTDYPALQLYTGSALAAPHRKNQGFALEPEFAPDSPNRPEFASPVLRAGTAYHKYVEYIFSKEP